MKKISKTLRPKLGFDCIGGDMTGIILENLSENGIIFHYGNLSLNPVSNVLTKDLIFMNKTMKGFWLTNYLKSLSEDELNNIYIDLLKYKTSTDYFNVNIVNVFKPNEVALAIKTYRIDMGKGKIILDFSS
jgi:NADPH:quinone reductase-like Zn-dependent oxidoreductase